MEPANGRIEAAFIPRAECGRREQRADEWLSGCEEGIEDDERRVVAVEWATVPGPLA